MSGGARYLGFGLALVASIGTIFATIYHEWKRNSIQSSQASLRYIYVSEGLWTRCTSPYVGQFQCDSYDTSIIGLPPELQGLRVMMVLACISIVISTIASIISLPCTGAVREKQKILISRVSGGLSILGGGLCIGSVSWYAANIIFQFWNISFVNDAFKYEFGAALYIGWVSAGIALIAGILLLCCTCGDSDEDVEEPGYRYTYKPPAAKPSRSNTEYV